MRRYSVRVEVAITAWIEVEADSHEEARSIAGDRLDQGDYRLDSLLDNPETTQRRRILDVEEASHE